MCTECVCYKRTYVSYLVWRGIHIFFLSAVMLINMDNIVIITRKYVRFNIILKSASIGFWKYFRQPSVFSVFPIKWHLWCLKRLRLGKYHQAAIVTNFLFQRFVCVKAENGANFIVTPTLSSCQICHHRTHDNSQVPVTSRTAPWASYQIRKIAGCARTGNAGNVLTATAG